MKKVVVCVLAVCLLLVWSGCLSKKTKNTLEIILACNVGFMKNIKAIEAETSVTSNGNIVQVGADKLKHHIQSMADALNGLDASASSEAEALATQNLVDHPETAASYEQKVSHMVSWIKEVHVLCANYAKNYMPTSSMADDENFLIKLNEALIGLSNDVLGSNKTRSILNTIDPTATQSAVPSNEVTGKKEEQK